MNDSRKRTRVAEFPLDTVRNLSIEIYKMRLEDNSGGGPGAVQRMIEKDKDEGQKLASRSISYDALTRCYLRALKSKELEEPK